MKAEMAKAKKKPGVEFLALRTGPTSSTSRELFRATAKPAGEKRLHLHKPEEAPSTTALAPA